MNSFTHLGQATLLCRVCRNPLSQVIGVLLLARYVFVNFFPMIEIVRQAGMNIGQAQCGKSQHNFFSSRTLLIVMDNGFETDACISYPDRPVFLN